MIDCGMSRYYHPKNRPTCGKRGCFKCRARRASYLRFQRSLAEASRILSTWPAWKRNVLGGDLCA